MSDNHEDLVLAVVRELLESPDITVDDDFFSAGGDSVLGLRLIGELSRRTGLRLRGSLLFANPLLREFCTQIDLLARAAATRQAAPETPLATALRSAGSPGGSGDAD